MAEIPSPGEVVGSHFMVPIVVASYFASLCGCYITIELLHRRGTGVKSKRSWVETTVCAVCLGLIGIWCMHFIGNRAIVLGDGLRSLQLVYSPGTSVASAFLPILMLMLAFSTAERQWKSPWQRHIALVATGVLSGFSVVGMHYIGNLGILNYKVEYPASFMAAAFVIALSDCLTVMVLFYTWREKWISRWWKRLICATLLAGGITAMHFTASTNCIYRFKYFPNDHAINSRNIQVIVAGAFCGTTALTIVGFMIFFHLRDKILKKRSLKVMLNCVMFHPDGRILVTPDGMLPAREITDRYNHRTFGEDFNTAHPVFQWIFRVSRNWSTLGDLIPKMKSHLDARPIPDEENSRPVSSASSTQYESETYSDYSIIFRERFCVAAQQLASSMAFPITMLGILYEKIIDTGTLQVEIPTQDIPGQDDVEMAFSPSVYGTGQLLFLTRRITTTESNTLIRAGFRFGPVDQLGRNIANIMQIPLSMLESHMSDLRRYVNNFHDLEKPGTYLSCFAAIPKVSGGGFDIVVKKTAQDQLPDFPILPQEPLPWQVQFLNRMHGRRFNDCTRFLNEIHRYTSGSTPSEQHFSGVLLSAMESFRTQVPPTWLHKSVFYGKPLVAHFTQPRTGATRAPPTILYAFVVCTSLHAPMYGFTDITPIPLSFFKVRQECYPGSPNNLVLAQDVHQEFAPLLARKVPKSENTTSTSATQRLSRTTGPVLGSDASAPSTAVSSGDVQVKQPSDGYELDNLSSDPREPEERARSVTPTEDSEGEMSDGGHGGILIGRETSVKSDNRSDFSINAVPRSDAHPTGLGHGVAVGPVQREQTFVDELMAFVKTITTTGQ